MTIAYGSTQGASLPNLGSTSLVIANPSWNGSSTPAGRFQACHINISANTTITPPSGWTTKVNASGVKTYTKVTDGSEGATYTFTRGLATNTIVGEIVEITSTISFPADPVDTIGAQASGSGNVVLPTLTPVAGTFLLQMGLSNSATTWTPPGTATEDNDAQFSTQSFGGFVGHETVALGEATGTRTWTSSVSGTRSGVQMTLMENAAVAPNDASHAHAAETPAITQLHLVTPDEAGHADAAESPAVTQVHSIAPDDSAHSHAGESPALTGAHEIAPAESAHSHDAESPTLAQVYELAPADSSHAHAAESPTVLPPTEVATDEANHAHATASPVVTQAHEVAPADAGHSLDSDSPSVSEVVGVNPDASSHAHTSGSPTLAQVHELVPADSSHTHTAGSPSVAQVYEIGPNSTTHGHAAESPDVTTNTATPDDRKATVTAENRSAPVVRENRSSTVPAEPRTTAA